MRLWLGRAATLAIVASAGCSEEGAGAPAAPSLPPFSRQDAGATDCAAEEPRTSTPPYLENMKSAEVFVRRPDEQLELAPRADTDLLRSYPSVRSRGPLIEGRRTTIMTQRKTVGVGEEVRVLHVVEIERPGEELYVMGPKEVFGEHVDGALATKPVPAMGAFQPAVYDGRVVMSPGVDSNFDVTSYTFRERGVHRIQWRAGKHVSNVLCVDVR